MYGYSDILGAGIGGGNLSSLSYIEITGGTVLGDSLGACGIGTGAGASGGAIAIGGNSMILAWGNGTYPDIGESLSSYVISGYAEVFLGENVITDTPTTSHTYEPGTRLAGPTLTGAGNAYNFSAPQIPVNWETNSLGGYFTERPAVNPATDIRGTNYPLIILITFISSLVLIAKYYFEVKVYKKK